MVSAEFPGLLNVSVRSAVVGLPARLSRKTEPNVTAEAVVARVAVLGAATTVVEFVVEPAEPFATIVKV
jgi:hypothetical protein